MPIVDAKGLEKRLGDRILLAGVDLTIVRGEKIGVVGSNGAGKSTLARILAGVLEADAGQINQRRGAVIAHLEQDPEFEAGQTVREIVLGGRPAWSSAYRAHEELARRLETLSARETGEELLAEQAQTGGALEQAGGWEVLSLCDRLLSAVRLPDPDQPVETLSGGERRRTALARLLFSEPDLAILDEPTNHMDAEAIEWLERYLAEEFRGAVLLITHDRWLLNQVADRTIEVDGGMLHSSVGGWEQFLEARATRLEREDREERNRQNFLRRELEWLRRQPKARTGKQKARVDRAEATLSVTKRKVEQPVVLSLTQERLGSTILEVDALSVEISGRTLLSDVSFRLGKGSRLGILGPSGVGKTSLIRTLLGDLPPKGGTVALGKTARIGYLDQLRSGLDEDQTVFDAVTGGRPSVVLGEQSYSSYSYLERFHFRGPTLRQKIAGLSGGERARIALAKLLLSPANVLVLDEPTNDLDVMTLGALEELLLELPGAAIIVSHDRYFIDKVATHVLSLSRDGGNVLLPGGFSELVEYQRRVRSKDGKKKEASAEATPPTGGARPGTAISRDVRQPKKLTYAEELELGGLPERIGGLETEKRALEAALGDPTLYTQPPEEAARLRTAHQRATEELELLELRWLELEERREALARKA